MSFKKLSFFVKTPLIALINKIIEEYVQKKSIDLVLNKKHILMGKNNYNITNEIMEILNTQN